jgi:hypothetical protein
MKPAKSLKNSTLHLSLAILLVAPASPNFNLQEWGFGGGGTEQSESTNYRIHGELNQGEGNQLQSDNYALGPGSEYALMADVAPAPTLANEALWYNKLKLTINPGPNPSDSTFAVAISPDNFTTTYYLQSDNTLGDTLGTEDWRTYTAWGGATGTMIIGLSQDTTYTVKVKSEQGQFTEAPWGPTASAATSPTMLSFDIDTASTDIETAPPYAIDFGELNTSGVNTAADFIWIDLDTNAEGGSSVYVSGLNEGLLSDINGHLINSITANLAAASEGYGAQVVNTYETSGGPLIALTPYNGTSENVGLINNSYSPILSSILEPIVGGRAQIALKAVITPTTPAASDYQETLTLVAAGTF